MGQHAPDSAFATPPLGDGPIATALGSAFVTLVEPHAGHELAYSRWYENDHFHSIGAMSLPWWFAGRRWVATRGLRALREPREGAAIQPLDAGCYLGTYWIAQGRHVDQWRWLGAAVERLRAEGRMFTERTHVHTGFFDLAGSAYRDASGPRALHALDYPYAGVVLELVDVEDPASRARVTTQLLDAVPAALAGSPVGMCVCFTPRPRPPADELWFHTPEADPARLVLLWFTDPDARVDWDAVMAARRAATGGLSATTRLVAPFIPTIPGTDAYVDQLR